MNTDSRLQIEVPTNGNLIRVHLDVINGISGLTVRERDVLSFLIEEGVRAFGMLNRRKVTEKIGLGSVEQLNVYIRLLKNKGVIVPDVEFGYRFIPLVIPDPNGLSINYT